MPVQSAYRSLRRLLTLSERAQLGRLIVGSAALGMVDVVGTISIIPFLALVGDPGVIRRQPFLAAAYSLSGLDTRQFLVATGVVASILVLSGILCRALAQYRTARFTQTCGHTLAVRLFRKYLGHDYGWHLGRSTVDAGRMMLDEVREVVNGPLNAAVTFASSVVVACAIVTLMVVLAPVAALAAVLLLGCWTVVSTLTRRAVRALGEGWSATNRQRHQVVQEAFAGIREVKLLDLEAAYLMRLGPPARRMADIAARFHAVSDIPRHLFEAIAFAGTVAFLIAMLLYRDGDVGATLPLVGVYAFASLRLLPLTQRTHASYVALLGGKPVVDALLAVLEAEADGCSTGAPLAAAMPAMTRDLALRGVSFTYPGAARPALRDVSLRVPRNGIIGLVGASGAGKSTLVDVMTGLIAPQAGVLEVDGVAIGADRALAWRRQIAYVSQTTFLVDGTIAANIAFGLGDATIDLARLNVAMAAAQLDGFIDGLPLGLDTLVGERGVRLSGGQRQRIAIARALYRAPEMLILDEATSALDLATETRVIDAIRAVQRGRTIVMISHRMKTLRWCDVVHRLDEGRIIESGAYADLAMGDD